MSAAVVAVGPVGAAEWLESGVVAGADEGAPLSGADGAGVALAGGAMLAGAELGAPDEAAGVGFVLEQPATRTIASGIIALRTTAPTIE